VHFPWVFDGFTENLISFPKQMSSRYNNSHRVESRSDQSLNWRVPQSSDSKVETSKPLPKTNQGSRSSKRSELPRAAHEAKYENAAENEVETKEIDTEEAPDGSGIFLMRVSPSEELNQLISEILGSKNKSVVDVYNGFLHITLMKFVGFTFPTKEQLRELHQVMLGDERLSRILNEGLSFSPFEVRHNEKMFFVTLTPDNVEDWEYLKEFFKNLKTEWYRKGTFTPSPHVTLIKYNGVKSLVKRFPKPIPVEPTEIKVRSISMELAVAGEEFYDKLPSDDLAFNSSDPKHQECRGRLFYWNINQESPIFTGEERIDEMKETLERKISKSRNSGRQGRDGRLTGDKGGRGGNARYRFA
jgi:hypothetical protein